MNIAELNTTARVLVARGKGLIAMDESAPTIAKRFKQTGIDDNVDNRRAYRQLLISTPGLAQYISGAILFDETLRQTTSDGVPFATYMKKTGIVPGIKVDRGMKDLAGFPGEKIAEGLDGLRERLREYYDMGARFAKWRATIAIGNGIPTAFCIDANAHALARYAALCQEAGLVPIVEPEVLIEGEHTLERCYDVSVQTLRAIFRELAQHRVAFEGTLLKASMVLPGVSAPQRANVEEVADATVRCMLNTVPAALAGIVFLSGGQGAEEATSHLNAMNARHPRLPWPISFSFARALQEPVMQTWRGDPANAEAAQKQLQRRAKFNGLAATGDYGPKMEKETA